MGADRRTVWGQVPVASISPVSPRKSTTQGCRSAKEDLKGMSKKKIASDLKGMSKRRVGRKRGGLGPQAVSFNRRQRTRERPQGDGAQGFILGPVTAHSRFATTNRRGAVIPPSRLVDLESVGHALRRGAPVSADGSTSATGRPTPADHSALYRTH